MVERRGRTIAVYPGAFRPPHINHFETVQDLVGRSDVDEVIVVVSNRLREVPGTDLVLDVDVALKVWGVYLRGMPKVRVELARSSAVSHALEIVAQAGPGDSFLLVVGQKDFDDGNGRFGKLEHVRREGVSVSITESVANVAPVSATDLRRCMADGSTGRDEFVGGLPRHLSSREQAYVWRLCCDSMVGRRELELRDVGAVLERNGIATVGPPEPIVPGKRDEVYRVDRVSGSALVIKHAKNTVSAARLRADEAKPRRRLKAERQALKWLRTSIGDRCPIELPEVICFDKKARTLVLSEVLGDGRTLNDDLADGRFDPTVASSVGRFLAMAHHAGAPTAPFWDVERADLAHWRTMLAAHTTAPSDAATDSSMRASLARLAARSDAARRMGFVHLDLSAKNVRVRADKVGVVDFELSSNIGDPACDLGTLLGSYLGWAAHTDDSEAGMLAAFALISAYRTHVDCGVSAWADISDRMMPFAGAAVLHLGHHQRMPSIAYQRMVEIGRRLLAQTSSTFAAAADFGLSDVLRSEAIVN